MIDKLEHRLPHTVTFRPHILSAIREIDFASDKRRAGGSKHYTGVLDLRPLGTEGLLHYRLKRDGAEGVHKLELLDTGHKPYSKLVSQIENVVVGDIDALELMRIDLCVDIWDVPVEWFRLRMRVRHKRLSRGIGAMKCQEISKRDIETISAGTRPNMIRVYNKPEECRAQLRKMLRKASEDADVLTLKSEFGFEESDVVTRIERQHGGGRIPPQIATFGDLQRLPDYNPFEPIQIVGRDRFHEPTLSNRNLDEWLKGTRLAQIAAQKGMQAFYRWLNEQSGGNAARLMRTYRDYFQSDSNRVTVDSMYQVYRDSIIKQLSA